MEQDWFLDKKNPYYKEKDCYIFRTANKCWMEIATKDLDSAFTEPFVIGDALATEKKKHKSGFALLKEKLAKAEAKNAELQKEKEIFVQTAQDNYCRVEKERDDWKAKYDSLNERHKTLLIDRDEWKKDAEAKQTTIEQQSRKISQLTADLHSSETLRLNDDAAHSKKEGEMLRAMGPIRRWWWNLHHLPTFKEDERWNETH